VVNAEYGEPRRKGCIHGVALSIPGGERRIGASRKARNRTSHRRGGVLTALSRTLQGDRMEQLIVGVP
jgi:hypothetical protein